MADKPGPQTAPRPSEWSVRPDSVIPRTTLNIPPPPPRKPAAPDAPAAAKGK